MRRPNFDASIWFQVSAGNSEGSAMIRRQYVVTDFFEDAELMRESLDTRFKNAYANGINWQYFCDPRVYAYLRTAPEGVFSKEVLERFIGRLRLWCMENLGLVPVHLPKLHLMINGCRLGLHSDFHNGVWGYVYSLTRWDDRVFKGGETMLLRDGVPSYKKHHVQGEVLYELVPAKFNQLLVFDDRIVHATPPIEGSMDPIEGRIAMVGHIRATSPVVSGSLPWVDVRRVVLDALPHLRDRIRNYREVQGTVTFRLVTTTAGSVESVTVLTDNLVAPVTGYEPSDVVKSVRLIVEQAIAGLKFPTAAGKSTIVVPVLIPLPDLRHLEFSVAHDSSQDALCEWAVANLSKVNELELKGTWQERMYVVQEPIAGSIRIESERIEFRFDPPMWVPSQRERFQVALTEWAKTASIVNRVRSCA